MKKYGLRGKFTLLIGLAWVLCCVPAWAALGQAPTLYSAPPGANLSAPPLAMTPLYTMTAVTLASGLVLKEFANAEGLVFAVSWRGPVQPDLSQLLGTYFAAFKQASETERASGQRGSPLSLAKDGLVVQASGRSPHFFGYAYATHLVPSGINVKDVVQ